MALGMALGSHKGSTMALRRPAAPASRQPLLHRAARPGATRLAVVAQAAPRDVRAKVAEAQTLTRDDSLFESFEKMDQWEGEVVTKDRVVPVSYSKQYDAVFQQKPLPIRQPLPKPCRDAQAAEPGCKKVLFSDVHVTQKVPLWTNRTWNSTDWTYVGFMLFVHGLACLAPFTFSWGNLGLFMVMYFISGCLGITLSFHRQLSHKSFSSPKWVEYALAYCGVLAVQGDPIEWVSSHRYHHLHTDTPLDPHSPYEGFWWSHMGWLLDNSTTLERVHDRRNASDLEGQPFYRWIRDTYIWHVVAQFVALYAFGHFTGLGGLGAVVWGGALRMAWVYHITWFVNSAAHCWGFQEYNTGDLSRNNWWVSVLAFGEGWHNTHHAFPYSARHGLEWWQFDMTWQCVALLKALGLATDVKLPTEAQKASKRFPEAAPAGA